MTAQVTKEINGNDYALITMGAENSIKMVTKLMKLLNLGSDSDASGMEMSSMLMRLLGNPDVLPIIKTLTENYTLDGLKVRFDTHFSNHKKDLLPCVAFSIAENILPFFDPDSLTQMAEMIAEAMEQSLEDA